MKKILLFALFVSFSWSAVAQNINVKVENPDSWEVLPPQKHKIEVTVVNKDNKPFGGDVRFTVMTDKNKYLSQQSKTVNVKAGDSIEISFVPQLPEAGFYRCRVECDGSFKVFNIALDPLKVISKSDAQPDFDAFWERALAELKSVEPDYQLTKMPESNSKKDFYLVKMKSLGGVEISGYYAVPVKKGKYPVLISYMGYGSKPWMPSVDGIEGVAEFVLSVRGQALNEPINTYGDWIQYKLDDIDNYYYRGAFMDVVRAIDFVCSREEIDVTRILAQGGSQGGAFTFAACALDNRIAAAAPDVPFLSDYSDYFEVALWPNSTVRYKQKELGLSNEEMFRNLSYFDIKNLAPRITCPIYMAYGLQDDVCPPHINFAAYNNITSPKKYITYPTAGHYVGDGWWDKKLEFFADYFAPQTKSKKR